MSDHIHPHGHPHDHAVKEHSPEETLALLRYMTDHNKHHAEELHELAHSAGETAGELIHQAVRLLEDSNDKLSEALAILKGE